MDNILDETLSEIDTKISIRKIFCSKDSIGRNGEDPIHDIYARTPKIGVAESQTHSFFDPTWLLFFGKRINRGLSRTKGNNLPLGLEFASYLEYKINKNNKVPFTPT